MEEHPAGGPSAKVMEAARWYAQAVPKPRPAVPAIKAAYGLNAAQAVEVIRQANLMLARAT